MKIPIQEKLAELERRIAVLERRQPFVQVKNYPASSEMRTGYVDIEPEVGGLWKAFDALMAKAFGW